MISHQKKIKNKGVFLETDTLFPGWWEKIDLSRSNAKVKRINYSTASSIIKKYEWLGTMPSGMKLACGLYFGTDLAAVECFTDSKAGSMYSLTVDGKRYSCICLARGASVFWAPVWAGSYLIQRSLKYVDWKQYDFVIAYSDSDAGEIGTVYQACNWYCIGKVINEYWERPDGKRFDRAAHRDFTKKKIDLNIIDGSAFFLTDQLEKMSLKVIGDEHLKKKKEMEKLGWQLKKGGTRYKYAYPLGPGKTKRYRMKLLESIAIPYPKREDLSNDKR